MVAVGDAVVPAALAQDLALTLHELGTNAVKYGALSRPVGRVTVEGGATVGPDGRELRLTWREAGGPPVAEPARPGYGTLLLSQAIAYGRGGEVALDSAPRGAGSAPFGCRSPCPRTRPRRGRPRPPRAGSGGVRPDGGRGLRHPLQHDLEHPVHPGLVQRLGPGQEAPVQRAVERVQGDVGVEVGP